MKDLNEALKHPLAGRVVLDIHNWEEWKVEWNNSQQAYQYNGLLHIGFDINHRDLEEYCQKVCLYLKIADRHMENYWPIDFLSKELSEDKQCKEISEKAFQMLCQRFFKNTSDKYETNPSWAKCVVNEEVLKEIVWFFRLKISRFKNIDIFQPGINHHNEIAVKFLYDFCKFIWEFKFFNKYAHESDKKIRKQLDLIKPATIDFMNEMDDFSILRQNEGAINEVCLKRLEKIAFEKECHFLNESEVLNDNGCVNEIYRHPKSLEEAVYSKSLAAATLLMIKIRRKERERQEKLIEIAREQRNLKKEADNLRS